MWKDNRPKSQRGPESQIEVGCTYMCKHRGDRVLVRVTSVEHIYMSGSSFKLFTVERLDGKSGKISRKRGYALRPILAESSHV